MNPNELIEATAQEIADIVYQKKFNAGVELLEMRFMIGEALTASPLWKRATRANLVKEVEQKTGLGDRSLRYCAEFKEKFGTWKDVMAFAEGGKLPAWREIVRALPSGHDEGVAPETRCKNCPKHCHE